MTSIAGELRPTTGGRALYIAHTVLCLGLNLAIRKIRQSRYARYLIVLLVLNEIRGLYVVYTAAGQAMPWFS